MTYPHHVTQYFPRDLHLVAGFAGVRPLDLPRQRKRTVPSSRLTFEHHPSSVWPWIWFDNSQTIPKENLKIVVVIPTELFQPRLQYLMANVTNKRPMIISSWGNLQSYESAKQHAREHMFSCFRVIHATFVLYGVESPLPSKRGGCRITPINGLTEVSLKPELRLQILIWSQG